MKMSRCHRTSSSRSSSCRRVSSPREPISCVIGGKEFVGETTDRICDNGTSSSLSLSSCVTQEMGSLGLETRRHDDDLEDDVPLMVRKTVHLVSNVTGPVEDVEDDLPLGYKHADAVVRKNAGQWRQSTVSAPFAQPDPMAMGMGMGGCRYPMMPPTNGIGIGIIGIGMPIPPCPGHPIPPRLIMLDGLRYLHRSHSQTRWPWGWGWADVGTR
jgi:hypothetical protein